jgi:cyclohexa-1,5-dienecarbonyl-CoA hydratase
VLDRPKANILDSAMLEAMRPHLAALGGAPRPKLLVFEGAGDHFSFGASVEEHRPESVAAMLGRFHDTFRSIEASGVPTAALVRGRCLGGALELAAFCGRVVCDPGALFGVPEVRLGVFPPVAAATLRWRVGGARASELILTGRTVAADEAVRIGLADESAGDPDAALAAWFETELAPKSSAALSFAWRASRLALSRAFERDVPELERLYLEELMRTADAVEGIEAFLEKRNPDWRNR